MLIKNGLQETLSEKSKAQQHECGMLADSLTNISSDSGRTDKTLAAVVEKGFTKERLPDLRLEEEAGGKEQHFRQGTAKFPLETKCHKPGTLL